MALALLVVVQVLVPSVALGANKLRHILADDGSKDSSFESFRSQLMVALKQHDKKFLEETLSPEITMALGGGRGKQAFNEQWDNLSPTSPFWARMQKAMSHGAQLDTESGEFHTPSLSFEDNHSDSPQCIAWNEKSELRKAPDVASAPIRKVFDEQMSILEPAEPGPVTANWAKVKTNSGTTGFIQTEDIYSAYDEFAVFKKRQQKWVLSWFGFAGL